MVEAWESCLGLGQKREKMGALWEERFDWIRRVDFVLLICLRRELSSPKLQSTKQQQLQQPQ